MSGRTERRADPAVLRRGGAEDAARAARLRRSAWLLALLASGFYLGFIAWNVLRTSQLG